MTSDQSTQHDRDDLFVAEFYPRLGEYLAEQYATGYDAAAGRARFQGWLGEHAADRGADEEISAPDDNDLAAAQATGGGRGDRAAVDPVEDYLEQVGKVAPLSAEQEVELAKRIEAGREAQQKLARDDGTWPADTRRGLERIAEDGNRAKNHLLEANLRLVVALANRFTGRGMPFLDLIQEGNLGLTRAVEKFDYTKGYRFSTYATWWSRQAITRAMVDQAQTSRIPVRLVEVINLVTRARRRLRQDLGREPTPDELASELGKTPEEVIEAQQYSSEQERQEPPDEDPAGGGVSM